MPECRTCAHCTADPDGLYCAHETSMQATVFGWGIAKARFHGFPCGTTGKLYQRASDEALRARGYTPLDL